MSIYINATIPANKSIHDVKTGTALLWSNKAAINGKYSSFLLKRLQSSLHCQY